MAARTMAGLLAAGALLAAAPVAAVPHVLDVSSISAVPMRPFSVAVSPDAAHVYAGNYYENTLVAFRRDASSGAIAFIHHLADDNASVELAGPQTIVMSPDGAHLYVAATGDDAVSVFSRDAGTGRLTFVEAEKQGIGGVDGIDGAFGVVVSPDGAHVYVSGSVGDAVAVFSRNAGTGALTFVESEHDGVGGVDGIDGARHLTISPDGAHVYVAGLDDTAVAVFARNGGTGALTFVQVLRDEVGGITTLGGAFTVAVSPDGAHVYVGALFDAALSTFSRNAGTGVLTFVEAEHQNMGGVGTLDGIVAVGVSPDGGSVYLGTIFSNTVTAFDRDAGTGGLTFVETEGGLGAHAFGFTTDAAYAYVAGDFAGVAVYARDGGTGALSAVDVDTGLALEDGTAAAVSPDGAHVLVAAAGAALLVFERDVPSGELAFLADYRDGIEGVDGLLHATSIAIAPDGAHVYVSSGDGDSVAAFSRNAGTGALAFVEVEQDGVGGVNDLQGAQFVAVSPDGAHVYVAARFDNAVTVFDRDAGTGALTLVEAERDGVGGVDGLAGARTVSVSPDGAHVYVAARDDDAVAIFARDGGSGALTFVAAERDGLLDVPGVAESIAFAPSGLHAYVASSLRTFETIGGALTVYARNATSGQLTLVEVQEQGVEGVDGLLGNRSTTLVTPDGTFVYVTGDEGTATFVRDAATGRLTFIQGRTSQSVGGELLGDPGLSPDGTHVYLPDRDFDLMVLSAGYTGCPPTPLTGCTTAGGGILRIKQGSSDAGDNVTWRFTQASTAVGDLGDTAATTHVSFCLYDESGPPELILRALVPAGGDCRTGANRRPCWKSADRYLDAYRTPEGISDITHVPAVPGRSRIILRARGDRLALPAMPVDLPLRAQLQTSDGACWEATYSTALANDDRRLRARPD